MTVFYKYILLLRTAPEMSTIEDIVESDKENEDRVHREQISTWMQEFSRIFFEMINLCEESKYVLTNLAKADQERGALLQDAINSGVSQTGLIFCIKTFGHPAPPKTRSIHFSTTQNLVIGQIMLNNENIRKFKKSMDAIETKYDKLIRRYQIIQQTYINSSWRR